jgi:serine/threonine protein phosphatase PrpC
MYSVWSVPGERQYMEDEYYVSGDGSFAAVFDGHGGGAVSR